MFGKTPLDYALKKKDKALLEAVIQGLFETEAEERERIMRGLPLNILLKYPAVYLPPLLREAGSSTPAESRLCNGAPLPKLFPLKKQRFAESYKPLYDL